MKTPTAPSSPQPTLLLAHAAMLSVAVIYGVNYYIIKGVLEVVSPFALLGFRIGSGLLFFGVLAWGKWQFDRADWWRIAACGLFGVAINQLFFIWGMSKTSPVNGGVIMTLTPALILIIAWLLKQERMTGRRVLGVAIAFGGAVLLSTNGERIALGGEGIVGDIMVFTNASSYAIYLVLVRPLVAKYPPMPLFSMLFAIGSVIVLPFSAPAIARVSWESIAGPTFWGVLYVIIFVTILAYTLNAWALRRVPSSQVGVYIYLQPMLVALLSPWLLSTPLTLWQWMYIGMVLAGVMLVNWKPK